MNYTEKLESWEKANIHSRIYEAVKESPIEMFHDKLTATLFVVFGRTVVSERWKKKHNSFQYLGRFYRGSHTKADVDAILNNVNNKLQ